MHLRQQGPEDDPAGEDAHRDLRQHVRHQGNQREHPAARFRETPLQKLRHGKNLRAHVEGHEHPRQHQQAPRMQLVVRHRHAVGGPRPRQPDNVLAADVARKNRRAYDEPAEVAAGEEVVVGRVFRFEDDPRGHAQQNAEIAGNREPVQGPEDALRHHQVCHLHKKPRKIKGPSSVAGAKPTRHTLQFYFVEKRYTVVVSYFSSGRRIVDGKCGLLGESG